MYILSLVMFVVQPSSHGNLKLVWFLESFRDWDLQVELQRLQKQSCRKWRNLANNIKNAVRSSCSSKGIFVMDIIVTTNLAKSRQNGVFKFSSGESTQSTLEVTKSMCSSENILPCRAVTFLLPLIYVNTTKLPFWQIERVVTKHIIHAASQIVSIYI